MSENNKSNAREYLLEYKTKKGVFNWLGLLIQKTIDTNGKVSDKDKDQLFTVLLKENNLESAQKVVAPPSSENTEIQEKKEAPSTNQQLKLQKITHKKGVNALILDQSITFSPACTIIYGLNGTGKSGYFRIIHELAGGDKTKSILGNIYKQGDGLEVDIDFLLDSKLQSPYKWLDKSKRGIAPFNQIKVFDSEYLPIFLNERESSVNIEPLGLDLFQAITSIIDNFKATLEERKQQKENQKPDLQSLIDIIHSENLKLSLQKNSLSDKESLLLEDNKTFSSEEITKLTKLKQQKHNIEKQNIEDSKKVLDQEKTEIDKLNTHLTNLKTTLEFLTKNISEAITDYSAKKKMRDEQIKQFEVLKNIPSRDTEEWQTFIESAKDYGAQIDQSAFNKDETCIYCHQPLNDEALKFVQAYFGYLSDQSQQNFKNAVEKIDEQKISLNDTTTDFSLSKSMGKILAGIKIEHGQDLKVLVNRRIEEAMKQKTNLAKSLKNKVLVAGEYSLDLLKTEEKLTELSGEKQRALNDLQQSESKKRQKIVELETEINKLEDKQNISKWKTKIEGYFSTCDAIQKYTTANQAINTRGITDLGSKAHDDLLTDSIRQSFEDELKALGKDIDVSLEKTSAGKGMVRTRLKILGNDVRDILSDGEQKTVGLALFLAEVESQNNGSPIVFDDPVTSVDHEVADFLAKKLLQVSQNRQIIIFSHNKLFYGSLIYWGNALKDDKNNKTHHVCKNYTQSGCNGKGCHIYTYKVDREAKDKTGRIFEAQNESCDYFIEKAENEMKGDYSLSSVAGYLKSAIEQYIDEKVLLKTGLMKDRLSGISVPWENLKQLESKKEEVGKLEGYWKDLSNRGTHITQNSNENPLKIEDFNKIIQFLKS